mgnify:CR=1 FL=1
MAKRERDKNLRLVESQAPWDSIDLPPQLITAFAEGAKRKRQIAESIAALQSEHAEIDQKTGSIASAYLLGLGVDIERDHYTIDLAKGELVLIVAPFEPTVPEVQEKSDPAT